MGLWDDGVRWHLEQVEGPDLELDPLTVAVVRDDHLRAANGTAEDDYIERLIRVSYHRGERKSWRSWCTQEWALVLDGFPWCSGEIWLPRPPIQAVVSVEYIDSDGNEQTWGGSPLPYAVSLPSGLTAGKAVLRPAYNQTWPTTRCQPDAVTVTYRAGYPEVGSPATCDIPEDLQHARLLLIGELYKQRSLSVHAFNQNPAIVQADNIFRDYRAY